MPEGIGSCGGVSLRNVAVTRKGIQAVGKVAAAVGMWDEFVEDMVAWGSAIILEIGD